MEKENVETKEMIMKTAMILLLMTTAAFAQVATEGKTDKSTEEWVSTNIDRDTKAWALKRAYELNGNSMVGWGSIDLTGETPVKPVQTVPIIPGPSGMVDPTERNALDKLADIKPVEHNICTHHHMRKVTTSDGQSWRCRK
jgi:hypothetical protein